MRSYVEFDEKDSKGQKICGFLEIKNIIIEGKTTLADFIKSQNEAINDLKEANNKMVKAIKTIAKTMSTNQVTTKDAIDQLLDLVREGKFLKL